MANKVNLPIESVLGCTPHCPYFPKSVGRIVDWIYDEKYPWLKRRAKPKKFVCQYDGSVIRSWNTHPCAKKLDELATEKVEAKESEQTKDIKEKKPIKIKEKPKEKMNFSKAKKTRRGKKK